MKRTVRSGRLLLLLVAMSAIGAGTAAADYVNQIHVDPGGQLNNQPIDPDNPIVVVNVGDQLVGTVKLRAFNAYGSSAVVRVGGTMTWGDRAGQVWQAQGHFYPGWKTFSTTINTTAPSDAGIYHIVFGLCGEFTAEQVMSASNWSSGPVRWNDGNDLGWDWSKAQFAQARQNGYVENNIMGSNGEYQPYRYYGATWVEVQVHDPTAVPQPSTLASFVLGTLGLLTKRRR